MNPDSGIEDQIAGKKLALVASAYFDDTHESSKPQKVAVANDFSVSWKDEFKVR